VDAGTIVATTGLVSGAAWPLVAIGLLLYLGRPMRLFLDSSSDLSLHALGIEASAR
jgi:hypothetical protein